MTKKDLMEWIESSKLPLKLGATKITQDMIILRRMTNKNQALTIQQEIMLSELIKGE